VKPLLNKRTLAKFTLLGTDFRAELAQHVDFDVLQTVLANQVRGKDRDAALEMGGASLPVDVAASQKRYEVGRRRRDSAGVRCVCWCAVEC
jgi:hypothetical protein